MITVQDVDKNLKRIETLSFDEGYTFYEVDGHLSFEVRGKSGGIVVPNIRIAYLMKQVGKEYFKFGIEINLPMDDDDFVGKINDAYIQFHEDCNDPDKIEEAKKTFQELTKFGQCNPETGEM